MTTVAQFLEWVIEECIEGWTREEVLQAIKDAGPYREALPKDHHDFTMQSIDDLSPLGIWLDEVCDARGGV